MRSLLHLPLGAMVAPALAAQPVLAGQDRGGHCSQAAGASGQRWSRSPLRNVLTSSRSASSSGSDAQSTLRQTPGLPARPSPSTMTGAGITVAIIDSGIADGLGKRITAFYDFMRPGGIF